ncbi:hypothetical protein GQ53DRAFT_742963 [Thozetella sp. PMI_491]|nr:hypothetical protein GQ53DRAFT_742963 [Thozetella sp. PMI_491]
MPRGRRDTYLETAVLCIYLFLSATDERKIPTRTPVRERLPLAVDSRWTGGSRSDLNLPRYEVSRILTWLKLGLSG